MPSEGNHRINKLAAGTANTTFQFKIIPIWDLKEHPKPMFIISTGAFQPGVKGGPSDEVPNKRSLVPTPSTPQKKSAKNVSDTFLYLKCWSSCVNLSSFLRPLMFFLLLLFSPTAPSCSNPGWNLFLLWFKLHLIVSVTGALSYQSLLHPQ